MDMALRGRPPVIGEPLVKRYFDLPESLNNLLVKASRGLDKTQVKIVREALQDKLTGEKSPSLTDEVRAAVREALQEQPGQMRIDVSTRADELSALADRLGYPSSSELVEIMALKAAEKTPEQLHEFLHGDVENQTAKGKVDKRARAA